MKKVLIIINPCAGTKQANRYFVQITDMFCKAGYETMVATTAKSGDGTEIAQNRAGEVDLVVCIGGDGTFNEVIAGVLKSGSDTPIGYIPAGTTNDFANSLGIPKGILAATRTIVEGEPMTLDVGRFNNRYFSYVASFGAFTQTSYNVSQSLKNSLGHVAYLLEGIKDIPASLKPFNLRLKNDVGVYGGDYVFGAICNSTSMGGILTLDEKLVDMNDGKFEVLLIRSPKNIWEINNVLVTLTTQKYEDCPLISFFSTDKVEIEADADMPWTLDGEYQEGCKDIIIENLESAIKIMVAKKEITK